MTLNERLQELGLTKHQREIAASKKPEDIEHLLWKVSENAGITNAAAYAVRSLKNLEPAVNRQPVKEPPRHAPLSPEEPEEPVAPLSDDELRDLILTVDSPWNEPFKAILEQRQEES
ncbi:MAG TPA: hypothetical protein VFM96_10120 [Gaiellaceae bacterium]|nr:hypothetical protein [Gaiellaceae bacterium]